MSVDGVGGDHSSMLAVYAQVGENYRQIDDLRLRLLALLPLATGTGLLVLLGGHSVSAAVDVPAGVFGMTATLSLYFYELHGVEKCAHYIYRGARLENDLGVPGSFTNRPHHIFGVVSELLPSALIYPASFAGWLFLALYQAGPVVRSVVTVTVLVAGAAASMKMIDVMEKTRWRRRAGPERQGSLARRRARAPEPASRIRPGRGDACLGYCLSAIRLSAAGRDPRDLAAVLRRAPNAGTPNVLLWNVFA